MARSLLLKTNDEPTFFNKEAAIGFLLAPPLGAVVGGFIGKARMEREKNFGKPVSDDPSFWNKDTLLGGLMGGTIGGLVAYGVAVAATATTAVTAAVAAPAAAAPAAAALVTVGAAYIASVLLPLGGLLLGAYVGGKSGQQDEREEFAKAQEQAAQVSRGEKPLLEVEYETHVSKDHVKQLQAQLEAAQLAQKQR